MLREAFVEELNGFFVLVLLEVGVSNPSIGSEEEKQMSQRGAAPDQQTHLRRDKHKRLCS